MQTSRHHIARIGRLGRRVVSTSPCSLKRIWPTCNTARGPYSLVSRGTKGSVWGTYHSVIIWITSALYSFHSFAHQQLMKMKMKKVLIWIEHLGLCIYLGLYDYILYTCDALIFNFYLLWIFIGIFDWWIRRTSSHCFGLWFNALSKHWWATKTSWAIFTAFLDQVHAFKSKVQFCYNRPKTCFFKRHW